MQKIKTKNCTKLLYNFALKKKIAYKNNKYENIEKNQKRMF